MLFLADARYRAQAESEAPECRIVVHTGPFADAIAEACRPGARVGFEASQVSVRMFDEWRARLQQHQFVAADGVVETLRIVKEAKEVQTLRQVAHMAGQALADVLSHFTLGTTERQLANALGHAMQERGLDGLGFPTLVASGPRAALPHAHPTDKPIQEGELVLIDYGGMLAGYRSDETVTVGIGAVDPRLREIYGIVREAQAAGIAAAQPGARTSEVDRAAREVIQASPYRDWCFPYAVGHGVGLDIHEDPRAAKEGSGRVDHELKPGMTMTVEPGIYVLGLAGVRLEDTLLITEDGNEKLTVTPKAYRAL